MSAMEELQREPWMDLEPATWSAEQKREFKEFKVKVKQHDEAREKMRMHLEQVRGQRSELRARGANDGIIDSGRALTRHLLIIASHRHRRRGS